MFYSQDGLHSQFYLRGGDSSPPAESGKSPSDLSPCSDEGGGSEESCKHLHKSVKSPTFV